MLLRRDIEGNPASAVFVYWVLHFQQFIAAQTKRKLVEQIILVRILKLHAFVAPNYVEKLCKRVCVGRIVQVDSNIAVLRMGEYDRIALAVEPTARHHHNTAP